MRCLFSPLPCVRQTGLLCPASVVPSMVFLHPVVQSAAKRETMAHASRNAQKRTSQKRRSALNSSMAMG